MIKNICSFLLATVLFASALYAQDDGGFILYPGHRSTLAPGDKISLSVQYIKTDGTPVNVSSDEIVSWNINGHALNALAPTDGDLSPDLTLTKAVYTAPVAVPEKNPVAVSVTLTSKSGKGVMILVCNVTVLKVKYTITMDAENTLAESGEDIKLHGECTAMLKALDDGTFMLEPVDKTRNMNVTVVQNKIVNAGGATGQIVTPQQYVFPFLFSIGTMDKNSGSGKATVYLNTTAPQTGIVKNEITAEGKTVTTIADIDKGSVTTIAPNYTNTYRLPTGGNLYAMDAVTHLNLLSGFATNMNTTIKNTNQNIAGAQQQMAWAKRLQAHQNDPAYFKTVQGKKDMQQMQTLQQQIGGNIKNEGGNTTAIRQAMAKKMKDDPQYAGSAQFHQDLGKLQMNSIADKSISGKPAMAEVSPGTARVRIAGTFDAKSDEAFSESLENATGPVHTTIKVKVEKTN